MQPRFLSFSSSLARRLLTSPTLHPPQSTQYPNHVLQLVHSPSSSSSSSKCPVGCFVSAEECNRRRQQRTCPKCNAVAEGCTFVCGQCENLLGPDTSWSYFDVLQLQEPTMRISEEELAKSKRTLQKDLHPDRYVHAPQSQKQLATESSVLVNKAHTALMRPLSRATYLLRLLGGITLDDNESSKMDPAVTAPEFLQLLMELNEQLDEARTDAEIAAFKQQVEREISLLELQVTDALEQKKWDEAKSGILKWRYFDSLKQRVDSKTYSRTGIHK